MEEAGGKMNVALRRHVRPSRRMDLESSLRVVGVEDEGGHVMHEQKEPGLDESSGTRMAGREQPQRWEANQNSRLVEAGPWAKCCCGLAEEEPEGLTMRFRVLWRQQQMVQGRHAPSSLP